MNIGSIRKCIRFLQLYPIVVCLALFVVSILDAFDVDIISYVCTIFGTSLFTTIGLYIISRSLYVASWSRVLYITLIAALLFDFMDQLFLFSLSVIMYNKVIILMLLTGIFSSLMTFIYDKFKYRF